MHSSRGFKNINLAFCPSVELISSTRRFVAELCDTALSDPDATSRVALTVHELLENTLKYSSDGHAWLDVALNEIDGRPMVVICSRSRATPENLAELGMRIDRLRGLEDPMQTYLTLMLDSAKRESGSGLGLARICVEAEMALDYTINGDCITVTAAAPVPSGGSA